MGVLEQVYNACQLSKYKSLGVVARTAEAKKKGEIVYEFLDYYPEVDTQEFQTCEWAVCGFIEYEIGEDVSVDDATFEVICVCWEQEAADALLRLFKEISGLPVYIEET